MDHSLNALLCFYLYNVVCLVGVFFCLACVFFCLAFKDHGGPYVFPIISIFGIVLCLEYIESMHFLLFGLVLSLLK